MDEKATEKDLLYVACKVRLSKDELSRLYLELDISRDDIQNAKEKADTKDFKLQAVEVLNFWRSSKGKDATRKAILEALGECDYTDAKETLETKWKISSAKKRRISSPTSTECSVSDTETTYNTRLHYQSTIPPKSGDHPKYSSPSAVLKVLQQFASATSSPVSTARERLQDNCRQRWLQFVGSIPADGNCFFHAVSDQLPRVGLPQQSAAQLREGVVQFLREHPIIEGPDGTINFTNTTPDWDGYLNSMSSDGTWADHIILVAMANMLKHDIFVVTSSPQGTADDNDQLWIAGDPDFNGTPIMLGHEWERHYRSLAPMVTDDTYHRHPVVTHQSVSLPLPSNLRSSNKASVRKHTGRHIATPGRSSPKVVRCDPDVDDVVLRWSEDLKDLYSKRRGKIQFGSHFQSVVNSESLFVSLELVQKGNIKVGDGQRKLETYLDLVKINQIENKKEVPCTHVLLRGHAGCGKSTLMNKLAQNWAQSHQDALPSPENEILADFRLVIALDVRKFKEGDSIQQAIKHQTLPTASIEEITHVIDAIHDNCLFLIDGYDEISVECQHDQTQLLDSPLLSKCWVIVTSRPHSIDIFRQTCQSFNQFIHVQVTGFSEGSIKEYIRKFFSLREASKEHAEMLVKRIKRDPTLTYLSKYPILLLMVCHLWIDKQDQAQLPESLTLLYTEAIEYLNKHWTKRYQHNKSKVMEDLGKIAITSLFDGQLSFEADDDNDQCLQNACEIGIIYREEMERHKTMNSFIHKTFHEYCSAMYWAKLAETAEDKFLSYLCKITDVNEINRMEYVLWFCCGLSIKAATLILSKVINILTSQGEKDAGDAAITVEQMDIPDDFKPQILQGQATSDDRKWNLLVKLLKEVVQSKTGVKKTSFAPEFNEALDSISEKCYNVNSLDVSWHVFKPYPVKLDVLLRFLHLFKRNLRSVCLRGIPLDREIQVDRSMVLQITRLDIINDHKNHPYYAYDQVKHRPTYIWSVPFSLTSVKYKVHVILQMLSHMPFLKSLLLADTDLRGKFSTDVLAEFKSITEFHIKSESDKPKMGSIMRLAHLFPSLLKLLINKSKLEYSTLMVRCKQLKELQLIEHFRLMSLDLTPESYEMSEHRLLNIMANTPTLEKMHLQRAQLVNMKQQGSVSMRQFQLTELALHECTIATGILARLLQFTPLLKELTMDRVDIIGDLEVEISSQMKALKVLNFLYPYSGIKGNTIYMLYKLYDRFSLSLDQFCFSVPKDTIQEVLASVHILKVHRLCRELTFSDCKLKLKTLMLVVSRLVSLRVLKLFKVHFIDNDDTNNVEDGDEILQSKSIEELKMDQCIITLETLYKMICCIPSLTCLKLWEMDIDGSIPQGTPVPCASLTSFWMTGNQISSENMLGLMSLFPKLECFRLDNVNIAGKLPSTTTNYAGAIVLKLVCLLYDDMDEHTLEFLTRLFSFLSSIDKLIIFPVKEDEQSQIDPHTLAILKMLSSATTISQIEVKVSESRVRMIPMDWLETLPAQQAWELKNVGLTSELHKDADVRISIKELKLCFNWSTKHSFEFKFLGWMKAIEKLDIINAKLIFEPLFLPSCDSLKELSISFDGLSETRSIIPRKWLASCRSLEFLQLNNVYMEEAAENELPMIFKSLKTFIMEFNHMFLDEVINERVCAMLAMIMKHCPNLQVLQLRYINIKMRDADFVVVSEFLKDLILLGVELNSKTMIRLLSQMPMLETIMLWDVTIEGDMGKSVVCKKIDTFEVQNCRFGDVKYFLTCMPSLQSLAVFNLDIIETDIANEIAELCPVLKTLHIVGNYNVDDDVYDYDYEDYDLSTILNFACLIPSLQEISINIDESKPNIDSFNSSNTIECKTIRTLSLCQRHKESDSDKVENVHINASSVTYILHCMPALETLTLCKIYLQGCWNRIKMEKASSLNKFTMQEGKVNGRVLLKLLACMSSLASLSLEKVGIEWELDDEIADLCDELAGCKDIDEAMRARIRRVVSEKLDEYIEDKPTTDQNVDEESDYDDDYDESGYDIKSDEYDGGYNTTDEEDDSDEDEEEEEGGTP